jgi:UDP-N-acetylglucosamine acyltransferase
LQGNTVHPTAVIGDHVQIGIGNTIGPYTVIVGRVQLGDDNWIGPFATIGTPAQMRGGPHPDWKSHAEHGIGIGSRNVIRENVTIHEGTERTTFVGDDCYLMAGSHVPHDAIIEDRVTLANAVHIGGHTWIGQGANLGLGVQVHQRTAIGAEAMIGMNATVTRHIPPFALVVGSPARIRRANTRGMERLQVPEEVINAIDLHYRNGETGPPTTGLSDLDSHFDSFLLHAAGSHV